MTAACLKLLHSARRPIWPFTTSGSGLLVEAFPAAQLCQWALPRQSYGRPAEQTNRDKIVDALAQRVSLGTFEDTMRRSADAIDAVLCAFAAMAVTRGQVTVPQSAATVTEGWIVVHS